MLTTNSWSGGEPVGGNFLLEDGHVSWLNKSDRLAGLLRDSYPLTLGVSKVASFVGGAVLGAQILSPDIHEIQVVDFSRSPFF